VDNENSERLNEEVNISPHRTVFRMLVILVLSIFVVETLLMLAYDRFAQLHTLAGDLLDGVLLSVLISPVMYLFLFRPMHGNIVELHAAKKLLQQQHDSLEEQVQRRTAELVVRNEQLAVLVQDLKIAEEKYRNLVECLPSITYTMTLDGSGQTIFVSPQIEGLGFPVSDWLETVDFRSERMHPDDLGRVEKAFAHSRETGEPFRCDYRLFTNDNKVRWFHDEASVVCDLEGKRTYLQGVMLDITENKAMEEELAEHRYRLEQAVKRRTELMERRINVLESANTRLCSMLNEYEDRLRRARSAHLPELLKSLADDVVIVTDETGLVTMLNPLAEQLLNAVCDQVVHRPLAEILPLSAHGLDIAEMQRRCLVERERVQIESATLLNKKGGAKEVFGWLAPIVNADGETTNLLVLLHPAVTDEACY
jgi:PAS domain S-box-containing protein